MNSYASAQTRDNSVIELNAYKDAKVRPQPFDASREEERWAGWQTLLFILVTCGTFWVSAILGIKALFS